MRSHNIIAGYINRKSKVSMICNASWNTRLCDGCLEPFLTQERNTEPVFVMHKVIVNTASSHRSQNLSACLNAWMRDSSFQLYTLFSSIP